MKRVIQSTLLLSLLLAPVPALAQADTTTGHHDHRYHLRRRL